MGHDPSDSAGRSSSCLCPGTWCCLADVFSEAKKVHIVCCVQCCALSVVSHVTILECFECRCCAYMVTVLMLVTQVQPVSMPNVACPKALTVVGA